MENTTVTTANATVVDDNVTSTWLSNVTNALTTSEIATSASDVTSIVTSTPTQPLTTMYDMGTTTEYYEYMYDEYMYPGYSFERPVYLYIWEILVIVTCLVNVIVISVLMRKKMRSATNMILTAIAISDSLTGLVTLPTYIMVYQRYDPYDPMQDDYYIDYSVNQSYTAYHYLQSGYQNQYPANYYGGEYDRNSSTSDQIYDYATQQPVDGYILTKTLCRGFMISKYFLSKSFHTISIFLTLFLGIQRYVSVAFPFKSQSFFSIKKTLIACLVIFVVSPILHAYHLGNEKAAGGLCRWELSETGCGSGCSYLWSAFVFRHFVPCVALIIVTVLFIMQLRLGEKNLRRMKTNKSQISRRMEENRRISIIVTAIVVVFLIPEIPYGIFLLYNAVDKTVNNGKNIDLETNRAIHMLYELVLVLSFHANFYIYSLFNHRFRKCLYRTYIKPLQRLVGDTRRLSISRTSLSSSRAATRKTECVSSNAEIELRALRSNSSDKSATMDTRFMESCSADITHSSHPDSHELEALNAKV